MKRRILEKLKMTEISAVDRPCQEDARVAILKRADEPNERKEINVDTTELVGAVIDLEAKMAHLAKTLAEAKAKDPEAKTSPDFEATVAEIRKRDACTHTEALTKARTENPKGFAAYQAGGTNADFDALVEAEIAKGVSDSVARQRVGLKYPNAAAAVIAKAGKHPFEQVVDAIMQQEKCSRAVAMQRARKKEPLKFHSYQEG
jgi:hypothetical protein